MALGGSLETLSRAQRVYYDVRDNFPSSRPPPLREKTLASSEESAGLLTRMFPDADRRMLRALTENLPRDTELLARTVVGQTERHNRHPHDFVIEKHTEGTTFTFVDPEHYVGTRNILRPPIGNLMRAFLPSDLHGAPSVAIVRFRTPKIAAKDPTILKMREQLHQARDLIERDGLPDCLVPHPEEILFRTVVRQASLERAGMMLVQSRYVDEKDEERFMLGLQSADALEGKIHSQQAIIHRFTELLRNGSFEPQPRFSRAA